MNKEKRKYIHDISNGSPLTPLIVTLLLERQLGCCEGCSEELENYQIHHKRYDIDITIDDLVLLCPNCHGDVHGLKACKGLMRKVSNIE